MPDRQAPAQELAAVAEPDEAAAPDEAAELDEAVGPDEAAEAREEPERPVTRAAPQAPAVVCARCGQEIAASDVDSGAAEVLDGLMLCPACLQRQPRGGADRVPEDTAGLLRSILMELRRTNRSQQTSSLTFLRLVAYIVQAGALFCGLVLGLMAEEKAMFLQIAILLQLVVIALLLIERNS
ncbi:MAG: hypothetical protein IMZ66_10760 [Planctomycetes bacterium]|nr:hypothetical protein [Planctomycetota bacterium]